MSRIIIFDVMNLIVYLICVCLLLIDNGYFVLEKQVVNSGIYYIKFNGALDNKCCLKNCVCAKTVTFHFISEKGLILFYFHRFLCLQRFS